MFLNFLTQFDETYVINLKRKKKLFFSFFWHSTMIQITERKGSYSCKRIEGKCKYRATKLIGAEVHVLSSLNYVLAP